MIDEYRGPTYGMGWSHKDRGALQQQNIPLLQNAFKKIEGQNIPLNNKPVLSTFSGLQLNTKLEDPNPPFDYTASAKFSPTEMTLELEDETNFHLGSFKQSSIRYQKNIDEKSSNCLELREMNIEIPFGFEGQGLGAGLAEGATILTPKWIRAMNLEGVDIVFSRCLAASHFSPEVTDEQLQNSERSGWTPEILKKYGYTNNPETLKYYLGATPYEKYPNKEALYVKVLLDKSKGIDLINEVHQ